MNEIVRHFVIRSVETRSGVQRGLLHPTSTAVAGRDDGQKWNQIQKDMVRQSTGLPSDGKEMHDAKEQ